MLKINISELNINKSDTLVVGVSAGPDSMALLHLLHTTFSNQIICCHINHNVRKESEEEEKYLEQFCINNNIIFEKYKIEKYYKNNFENEAREKRYSFYEKILRKYNSHYLFLAHHGDDLIETILMKIARGSNIEGYAGMKKISKCFIDDYHYFIVRPFLEYTKDDLINYNKEKNIKYFIDSSNTSDNYTRNRYRNHILPFLKNEDADIHTKFLKYSNVLLEYDQYIKTEVLKIKNNIYKSNILKIDEFNKLDLFIKKNILYSILNDIYNNKNNIIKEKHVIDIINIIDSDKPNIYINLPKDIIIKKEYNNLIFKSNNNINNTDYCIKFDNFINKDNYIIEKVDKYDGNGNDVCRINSKNIKLPLYIRNRKDNDYMEVMGLGGKKKIKDIFIDEKIPTSRRNSYPLLVDSNDNILWIPNIKKSKFNEKNDGFYDIILRYYEKERYDE